MSDFYESDIEPNFGVEQNNKKKKKLYKVKMKCKQCGYIGYEILCPDCQHATFKYTNIFGQ